VKYKQIKETCENECILYMGTMCMRSFPFLYFDHISSRNHTMI